MHTTECTSEGGKMRWNADMSGTRLIAQGCVGTDVQGLHVVHAAGGAIADLNGCTCSVGPQRALFRYRQLEHSLTAWAALCSGERALVCLSIKALTLA